MNPKLSLFGSDKASGIVTCHLTPQQFLPCEAGADMSRHRSLNDRNKVLGYVLP